MATVSPYYQQKGVANPYYVMDQSTIVATKNALKTKGVTVAGKDILFKAVDKVKGKTIKDNVKIPTNVDIALSNIDLVIYNVLGQEIYKKTFQNLLPGNYEYVWDGTKFHSGVYIYTIKSELGEQLKEKMILIK